jgi:hypothetical protein
MVALLAGCGADGEHWAACQRLGWRGLTKGGEQPDAKQERQQDDVGDAASGWVAGHVTSKKQYPVMNGLPRHIIP